MRIEWIGTGIRPGWTAAILGPKFKTAIVQGLAVAWTEFAVLQKHVDAKEGTS